MGAMLLTSDIRAAASGMLFRKKDRSRLIIDRLTGGRNIGGTSAELRFILGGDVEQTAYVRQKIRDIDTSSDL